MIDPVPGSLAVVTAAIVPGGLGEVSISFGNRSAVYPAIADEPFAVGDEVVVVRRVEGKVVHVTAFV